MFYKMRNDQCVGGCSARSGVQILNDWKPPIEHIEKGKLLTMHDLCKRFSFRSGHSVLVTTMSHWIYTTYNGGIQRVRLFPCRIPVDRVCRTIAQLSAGACCDPGGCVEHWPWINQTFPNTEYRTRRITANGLSNGTWGVIDSKHAFKSSDVRDFVEQITCAYLYCSGGTRCYWNISHSWTSKKRMLLRWRTTCL